MKIKEYSVPCICGAAIGFINGFFGAGGGTVAVPVLKKLGFEQKQAHENAVAVILPLSAISAAAYILKGYVELSDAAVFIPAGIIGAVLGTFIIKKINPVWLKKIFGAFMAYAGIRLLLK